MLTVGWRLRSVIPVRLTGAADTSLRTVQAGSGYLSSGPTRLHFGLPAASASGSLTLTVTWPDGRHPHPTIRPHTLVTIQR